MSEGSPFGADYADAYDLLYETKDYDAECRFIRDAVERHARTSVTRVLDLGCGTGQHAVRLAELGRQVTGLDRSEPMLRRARARAATSAARSRLRFERGDIGTFRAGTCFDLVLMMFAVIGYQVEDAALDAALATARDHLDPGGLLIFDCWYGPAVLAQRPGERVKRLAHATGTLTRIARGALDVDRHVCTVDYDLRWSPKEGPERRVEERHSMRFFFADELAALLERSGFVLRELLDFECPDRAPSEASWNVWCVAEALPAIPVPRSAAGLP